MYLLFDLETKSYEFMSNLFSFASISDAKVSSMMKASYLA